MKGHLKWKVTDLSRSAKISRSRIYELLGRNKSDILKNALILLLEEMYGLSAERQEFERTHSEFEGFMASRQMVMQAPELLSFYFRNRDRKDDIGEIIRTREAQFLKIVARKNDVKDPLNQLFVRTVIHGVSLAPFLSDDQVSACMRKLSLLIKEKSLD